MSDSAVATRARITVHDIAQARSTGDVERPVSQLRALVQNETARKLLVIVLIASAWEIYGRIADYELLFPTFSATVDAFWTDLISGRLPSRVYFSMRLLAIGYATGFALALFLTILAMSFSFARDILMVVTSMLNPLPAIALLPLSLMWFGIGDGSIVFVLVHSVLWPVALNTLSGFLSVPNTLRMVGRNYGLSGLRFALRILIPAALPSIFAGVKIGWAFAWRTLVAAELVFGVSSGSGGIGWYIYERKNSLETPSVFAGLLTVIIIGLIVENFVFRPIEKRTIRKWGLQS